MGNEKEKKSWTGPDVCRGDLLPGRGLFRVRYPGGGVNDYPSVADSVLTLTSPGEYAAAIPSGVTKLVVDANGEVTLSSATAYEGEVEIRSGSTLNVASFDLLANAPITVNDGGTLCPTFEGKGQFTSAFLKPITISGSGVDNKGAFRYGGPAGYKTDALVDTLVLAADATIDCSVRWGVSGNGKQGLIDLNGHTLTRIGTGDFMFTSSTMTPGEFVNSAGTITFSKNNNGGFGVEEGCKGEETKIVLKDGTVSFWDTNQRPLPYKLVFEGGAIKAGAGKGPDSNLITGPVEIDNAMTIWPGYMGYSKYSYGFMGPLALNKNLNMMEGGTLYLGGPITGGGQLLVTGLGLVSITNEQDAGSVMLGMTRGRVDLDVGEIRFHMFRCGYGRHKEGDPWPFGAFHHKRGDVVLSNDANWEKPSVGELGGSFGTYTFEAGGLYPTNSFYLAQSATSRGFFRQRGGRFEFLKNQDTNKHWYQRFQIAGCDAQACFVQTGGTNDLLSANTWQSAQKTDVKWRTQFGVYGATNLLFALADSNTIYKTDGFAFGCETNRTTGVIAVNDGATLAARRFGSQDETMKEGTDITLSLNGGVLAPLFHGGWSNIGADDEGFLTQRVPQHVVVGPKGAVIDTSDCVTAAGEPGDSQLPLTFKAPEGQGIASVELPNEVSDMAYYGAVQVEIEGPAGSYGASAYGEWDETANRLKGIVITSAGCNYDATTKVYVQCPTSVWTRYECKYTLTGEQASGPLVKRGANGVTLYGANTCTGGTVVAGGTLTLASSASIPANTPLKVMDGATFDNGGKALTVSILAGAGGSVTNCSETLKVTEALEITAAELFSASGPLTVDGKVVFGDDVVVRVTDPENLPQYRDSDSRTFLKATQGFEGAIPKLKLRDSSRRNWIVYRSNNVLRFGPEKGFVLSIR